MTLGICSRKTARRSEPPSATKMGFVRLDMRGSLSREDECGIRFWTDIFASPYFQDISLSLCTSDFKNLFRRNLAKF